MCGIAGSIDRRGDRAPDEAMVARMSDLLAHRGPDDAGMLVDPPVVLGHRRLSIIDLSDAGHQPMSSDDERFWITFNGEIYNYRELAAELVELGHVFRSASDTEVLLAAYEKWGGAGSLERMNGMFAFAIWDREQRELFCARDRFGVKPFYYTAVDGYVRFASEIKALLIESACSRRPNLPRVREFLAHGYLDHTDETLFEGIFQLPPGHFLRVGTTEAALVPQRWYTPKPARREGSMTEMLRSRLTDAVRIRLRSDVPVGTTLSGGLDSTSVTAIATELRASEDLPPAATFSARCDDPAIDEGPYIATVLERIGAPNHEFTPRGDGLLDDLDHVLWHMDEPFHNAAVYGHWQMSSFARSNGITVMLDGQGGDEALAGYAYLLYPGFFFSSLVRLRLGRVWREARARARLQGIPLGRSVRELVRAVLPQRILERGTPAWLTAGSATPPRSPGRTLVARHLHGLEFEPLAMYNHELDRNTMAVSLEARSPFLDYRVVECGLAMTPSEHVHDGYTKWTLRQAMRDLLPSAVVDRPKKQGFTTDETEWMRGGLGEAMQDVFESSEFAGRGLFQPAELLHLLDRHRTGNNNAQTLWRAFIVERWYRLFIDPAAIAAPAGDQFRIASAASAADAVIHLEDVSAVNSAA